MTLLLNSFLVDVTPHEVSLPFVEYETWEGSTEAKKNRYPGLITWRYSKRTSDGESGVCMVFLSGTQLPDDLSHKSFDLGTFSHLGCRLIEDSVALHFSGLGFTEERNRFERIVLRKHADASDTAIELATGLAFSARRPFSEERYAFSLTFQWVVRAMFKQSLVNASLSSIALGMPVMYMPTGAGHEDLDDYKNRYLGKVRNVDQKQKVATVACRDGQNRSIELKDLRLEASPAAIKIFERTVRSRQGPSRIIRTIQQLKLSLTKDNRRNVTVLRDRLAQIRKVLYEVGSSRDQLVIPLASSFQPGSVSVALTPTNVLLGEVL
jgi:hypothetical protein